MEQIKTAQFKNIPVTKENIKTWVKKDIGTLYSLAHELLSTPEAIDALVAKLYESYEKKAAEADRLAEELDEIETENA